jgi:hypothetical protein
MLKNRRLSVLITAALIAVAVIAAIGVPLTHFTSVSADYASEVACGGGSATYQIRLFASTQTYADAGLSVKSIVIPAAPTLQKYLVCDFSLGSGSYAIDVAGFTLYVPKTAGPLVPRAYADNQ